MPISEISAIKIAEATLGPYIANVLKKAERIKAGGGDFEIGNTYISVNEDKVKIQKGMGFYYDDTIDQTFPLADPNSFEKIRSLATILIDDTIEEVGEASRLQSYLITKDKSQRNQLRYKSIKVEIHGDDKIVKSDKKPFWDFRYEIWGVPRGSKASILRNGITRPFYVLKDYDYDKEILRTLERKVMKKEGNHKDIYRRHTRWNF